MYLIYIDDYGNTGSRLDDLNQPIFALFAALVSVEHWTSLETELVELVLEMKKYLNTSTVPRLHAVDLYQRKGIYREASIEQTFDWIEKILAAGLKHKVMYHARIESKARLREEFLQGTTEQRRLAAEGKSQHPLYRLYFPHLLFDLQDYLEEVNGYGLLIVDQQKEHNHYGELEIYRAWRTKGFLTRVLEAPIYRDSRLHTGCIPNIGIAQAA